MDVIFTAEADGDLYEIGRNILQHNPSRASTYIAELHRCCADLAQMSLAYPLVLRRPALGIRRRAYGNYLIFYRVTDSAVQILHILHGARNHETILFPDDN